MKQSLFVNALKFASHAMAVKDVRYYLNGVLFEFRKDVLTLVGTDGHRMAYVDLASDSELDGQWTIPADSVKLILTAFKATGTGFVSFVVAQDNHVDKLTVQGANGQVIQCTPIDGKYPDWRRVCKSGGATAKATISIGMNTDYLSAASKACGALSSTRYKGMRLTLFGETESILCFPDELPEGISGAAVVVMPMRL